MRSNTRSSTAKQGNNKGAGAMEVEKIKKLKDEPHLSGAYIRNLVKQLTSSRSTTKESQPKQGQGADHVDENEQNQETTNHSMSSQNPKNQPQQQQQQQPKKQVRRRLHTSRPYQERLLNMAEARREIVTALKFHRASMKQANEQQQQQQQQSLHNLSSFEHEQQERRNPRIYPSNTTTANNNNFTNYLENSSYSSFSCPTPSLMQPNMNHFLCTSSPCIEPTLPIIDHLNLTTFPNHQPLGLNLNFHDFNNLDTTSLYYNNNSQFSMYSYPSPSSSSSPPPTLASTSTTTEETHSFVGSPDGVLPHSFPMTDMMIDATGENGLHPTMDDDEMAEIRSLGEQHEMEWNDTLNLVTSAWWFKYLKKMEINNNNNPHDNSKGLLSSDEDGIMNSNLFDEVMEFPSWMNSDNSNDDESFFLQQHLDDSYYSHNKDYFQESALPCMDIGEIDGIDSEWLA
ncbi:hypothetical protein MKW94_000122 [Papaver nudicaule]|uniref:Uncharacterized protein n=1 Tax=Papaver nudicaule TaxID=74823 RepID=A0AA41S5E9_PAPNU|nr:hypothetical protein [Papaver nudicaule]